MHFLFFWRIGSFSLTLDTIGIYAWFIQISGQIKKYLEFINGRNELQLFFFFLKN